MSEYNFEVKQSKKIMFLVCICVVIFILVFLSISIFTLINLLNNNCGTFDEVVGNILVFCFSATYVLIFTIILIYMIIIYKKQVDIFKTDRLVRQRNGKIIFEVFYENIVSIKEGYNAVFMILKKPIVKNNGKKGPRNFYEHYSQNDIRRIKQIITDKYFNIQIL